MKRTVLLFCLLFAFSVVFASSDCNINSFEVVQSLQSPSSTTISYDCFSNNNDVNLIFLNLEGVQVYPLSGVEQLKDSNDCNTSKKSYTVLWSPTEVKKLYQARLSASSSCVKEFVFGVKANEQQLAIPDSNILLAVVICALSIFIVSFSKKKI